jgi:glycosyltransferase involved in cell wall biosynthesis
LKQYLIQLVGDIYHLAGKIYGTFHTNENQLFFIFPLSSIGGAELVHYDIIRAIKNKRKEIIIWYRHNPWKKSISSQDYALETEFKKQGVFWFFEDKIKGQFENWNKRFYQGFLFKQINKKNKIVVIRNGDSDFKKMIAKKKIKFKLFVVTHNAYAELENDDGVAKYLDVDVSDQIYKRILITDSLSDVIDKSYYKQNKVNNVNEVVIYNAVTIPKTLSNKDKNRLDVLFAARDSYEKQFSMAYEIARSCSIDHIHFHFVGPNPEKFQKLRNATFYGEIKDQEKMASLYKKCHVFLLTSLSEGFPRSIAEAMANGEVIITTDVGSIKDHVSEKNGLIIHTNNTETISKVQEYLDLLKNNTELLLKISLYNREYAIANFAYSQFEKKYNELLSLS